MTKEMIISSNGHETMVAILEDDLVAEIFVERERQRGVVGNVYKGRVSKVLPGMQSSFIDLGLERDGFLYVTDVIDTARGIRQARSRATRTTEGPATRRPEGRERRARPQPKIEDLLKEGQEILVQVVKEPLGTKGARLTSHVTMPGRFLVFMPTVDHVGVSRKIESRDERVAPARHRPRVPRGARLHRRRHHPHRRRRPAQGRHRQRPRGVPRDLDRDPPEDGVVARAGRRLPRAEPRRQAAARSADRRVPGDPHRQRAGVPARARPGPAHPAEPGAAGEALHEAVSDLRRVRRAGRDRQGAEEQGLAEVGRLDRHQPDRSAGRDRRQHRPLRRQEDERAGSRTRSSRRTSRR